MKPWILLAGLGLLLNACNTKNQQSSTTKNLFLTVLHNPDVDLRGLFADYRQPEISISAQTGLTAPCSSEMAGNFAGFYGPSYCNDELTDEEWALNGQNTPVIRPGQADFSEQPVLIFMTEAPGESHIYNKGNAPAASGSGISGNGKIIR